MMVTWLARMAAAISGRRSETGRSGGKVMGGMAAAAAVTEIDGGFDFGVEGGERFGGAVGAEAVVAAAEAGLVP